jgi:dienelactone hydrolase
LNYLSSSTSCTAIQCTQRGFNNDTTPRFDKEAAALAWRRTLEFSRKDLRGAAGSAAPPP